MFQRQPPITQRRHQQCFAGLRNFRYEEQYFISEDCKVFKTEEQFCNYLIKQSEIKLEKKKAGWEP